MAHYLIAVFFGRWAAGEPVAGSDAAAARFVPVGDLSAYPLTEGAAPLIGRALQRLRAESSLSGTAQPVLVGAGAAA